MGGYRGDPEAWRRGHPGYGFQWIRRDTYEVYTCGPLDRGPGSRERKRARIRAALLEQPLRSDREISYQVGCDHKTVAKVRREMELANEIPVTIPEEENHTRNWQKRANIGTVAEIEASYDDDKNPITRWNGLSAGEVLAKAFARAIKQHEARYGPLYDDDLAEALALVAQQEPRGPHLYPEDE